DNGEAEVAGGGFALPGLQNNVPEHVGPVIAAPPGVKAGTVVRSGALTPPPYPTEIGAKQKKPNTLAFFFLITYFLKTKKNKKKKNTTTKP
ncbi:hypothetical protein ACVGW2_14115, partial [Enterobacter intestinihominis]